MHKVQFAYDDEIISICYDQAFKAVFTRETPQSRGALEKLLSAILEQETKVLSINTNEPPVNDMRDRQIRYDINLKLQNGELANLEMTLNPGATEAFRIEYQWRCPQDVDYTKSA